MFAIVSPIAAANVGLCGRHLDEGSGQGIHHDRAGRSIHPASASGVKTAPLSTRCTSSSSERFQPEELPDSVQVLACLVNINRKLPISDNRKLHTFRGRSAAAFADLPQQFRGGVMPRTEGAARNPLGEGHLRSSALSFVGGDHPDRHPPHSAPSDRRNPPRLPRDFTTGWQRQRPRFSETARAAAFTSLTIWRILPLSSNTDPPTPIAAVTFPSRSKIGAATPLIPRSYP